MPPPPHGCHISAMPATPQLYANRGSQASTSAVIQITRMSHALRSQRSSQGPSCLVHACQPCSRPGTHMSSSTFVGSNVHGTRPASRMRGEDGCRVTAHGAQAQPRLAVLPSANMVSSSRSSSTGNSMLSAFHLRPPPSSAWQHRCHMHVASLNGGVQDGGRQSVQQYPSTHQQRQLQQQEQRRAGDLAIASAATLLELKLALIRACSARRDCSSCDVGSQHTAASAIASADDSRHAAPSSPASPSSEALSDACRTLSPDLLAAALLGCGKVYCTSGSAAKRRSAARAFAARLLRDSPAAAAATDACQAATILDVLDVVDSKLLLKEEMRAARAMGGQAAIDAVRKAAAAAMATGKNRCWLPDQKPSAADTAAAISGSSHAHAAAAVCTHPLTPAPRHARASVGRATAYDAFVRMGPDEARVAVSPGSSLLRGLVQVRRAHTGRAKLAAQIEHAPGCFAAKVLACGALPWRLVA